MQTHLEYERVCPGAHTRATDQNRDGANAPAPSAGLTGREKTKRQKFPVAGSRRAPRRSQPTPTFFSFFHFFIFFIFLIFSFFHLFHRFGVGSPGSAQDWTGYLGHVFLVSQTLLTGMLPSIQEISRCMPTPKT